MLRKSSPSILPLSLLLPQLSLNQVPWPSDFTPTLSHALMLFIMCLSPPHLQALHYLQNKVYRQPTFKPSSRLVLTLFSITLQFNSLKHAAGVLSGPQKNCALPWTPICTHSVLYSRVSLMLTLAGTHSHLGPLCIHTWTPDSW